MKFEELFEGIHDKNIFKAIIIVGSPGAGKSWIVDKLALRSQGLVKVTSDSLFERFIKQYGLSLKMPDEEANIREPLRFKAQRLSNTRQQLLMDGRIGLIIEGTGYLDRIESLTYNLEKIGYDVCLVFVNSNLETAQARNATRDRSLPPNTVKALWNNAQQGKTDMEQMFGYNFFEVDTENLKSIEFLNKQIRKWLSSPPSSPIAQEWISKQKTKSRAI